MMIRAAFYILLLSNLLSPSYANPTPFGLKLGETTAKQIEAKYKILGKGKDDLGDLFFMLDPKVFDFDGLKEIGLVFDKDNILQIIRMFLNHNQFDRIHEMLSEKYRVKNKPSSTLRGKIVIYESSNTKILLSSYKTKPYLVLSYTTQSFLDEGTRLITKKEKELFAKQKSKL